ncbi:MAG: sensor histidine kinase [Chloroflexota bacterium]
MRSITLKLIGAFLAIGLISIAIIVLLARQNTRDEFNRFVAVGRGEDLVTELADYYRTHGSWDGVQEVYPPGEGGKPYPSFTIADSEGQALCEGGGFHTGDSIPEHELNYGVPIIVDEETVGVLVLERMPFPGNPREEEFIQRVNSLLLYSALGATIVALLLGVLLSRTLTRPIRELTAATQSVADGKLGLQVSVRSRDELGELAASFNKMSADLARSVNARRQMTADIAHELRTPLSLILGHAEAVHDGVLPPTRENFEIIRDEAARLEHLVDDLRTLSLADAGELSMEKETVKPKKLLQEVASLYQYRLPQKNISLDLQTPDGLPDIKADASRLTQVLTNLLDNALRHTPDGGRIVLAARGTKDGLLLWIQDSGPGVAGGDLGRIFDRFYRLDSARTREQGGSGLGLAIARSIVQAHGGQMWAESQPGQGLAIFIQLPAQG